MWDKKTTILSTGFLILYGILVFLVIWNRQPVENSAGNDPQFHLDYANTLKVKELYREAIAEYEKYMESASIPLSKKANITYQIGNIYLDKIHDYKKALAAFLKVELIDSKSSLVKDARKNQVECLERLGRSRDAQEKLNQITSLKAKPEKGETVIARVGNRVITDRDLQKRIDQLPPYAREQLQSKDKKLDFLKQFIASELMYDTAKRKGLDKDTELMAQVFETKKALMVQKLFNEEIQSKVKVEESDLKLYFQAHKSEFRIKERRKVSHILCKTVKQARAIIKRIKNGESFQKVARMESLDIESSGKGGDLGYLTRDGSVPGLGKSEVFLETCFSLKPGKLSKPIKTEKGFHVILVTDVQEPRDVTFEEVEERVRQAYTRMKQEELYKNLIDRMLKAENVKIHEDKLSYID